MSKIIYKIGSKEYSFSSQLQLKDIPLVAVEENMNEEVRMDIQRRNIITPHSPLHDITLIDDNGIIATAKDFTEIGNLTINKDEKRLL